MKILLETTESVVWLLWGISHNKECWYILQNCVQLVWFSLNLRFFSITQERQCNNWQLLAEYVPHSMFREKKDQYQKYPRRVFESSLLNIRNIWCKLEKCLHIRGVEQDEVVSYFRLYRPHACVIFHKWGHFWILYDCQPLILKAWVPPYKWR